MAEASNPTSRVIDVLNFLAAHPTETFSLADIARALGLSNGSAHRILTTLAQAGFLARSEKQRTYALGAAMVAIGEAAVQQHRGVEAARRELARLAVELNLQCSASTVTGDEVLVLVKEGVARSHRGLTRVGERRPLLPPLAMCHLAWAGADEIDAYVARSAPHLSAPALDRLAGAFPLIRRRGYAIVANGPATGHSRAATVRPAGQIRDEAYWEAVFDMVGRLEPDEIQLLDAADAGAQGIAAISAPVFAPDGRVALQLVASGMPPGIDLAGITHCIDRLCAIAASITSETYGHAPEG